MIARRRSGLALIAAALALLIGTPCRCLATVIPTTSAVAAHSCCADGAAHTSQPAAKAPSERHHSCDHCSIALSRTSAVVGSAAPQAAQAAAVAAPLSHTPWVDVSRFDHPPPPSLLVTQRFLVFRSLLL
jgi:hypothetical protein